MLQIGRAGADVSLRELLMRTLICHVDPGDAILEVSTGQSFCQRKCQNAMTASNAPDQAIRLLTSKPEQVLGAGLVVGSLRQSHRLQDE
jgi:hypothetical protein